MKFWMKNVIFPVFPRAASELAPYRPEFPEEKEAAARRPERGLEERSST